MSIRYGPISESPLMHPALWHTLNYMDILVELEILVLEDYGVHWRSEMMRKIDALDKAYDDMQYMSVGINYK